MAIVRVALDLPVSEPFDYVAEADERDVGERALVPVAKRSAIGVVVEVTSRSAVPTAKLKRVTRILRGTPRLSPADLKLLRFASEYYHHPLGQVIASALPQVLRRPHAHKPELQYALTEEGTRLGEHSFPERAVARRALYATMADRGVISASDITRLPESQRRALHIFIKAGWVCARERPLHVAGATAEVALESRAPRPTSAQAGAAEAISLALGTFHAFLLLGVTGSGKTEVYLRAAEAALSRGEQVLLLVPEIALTPQLESMVRDRFPHATVAGLHSGLSEGERVRNWLAAQSGAARIVLGTRLAVFAPLQRLGLVVVDEEHDASYKQSEGFHYSARDLAIVRAREQSVPVVLGSATPSLETYHNVERSRYTLLELRERVNSRPPRISCVRIDAKTAFGGIAPQLLEAAEGRIARHEQTLFFINRRGYAPVLMCHSCGWLSGCHRCSAKLVLHLPSRALHCHHCGYRAPVPAACPNCGNPGLTPIGQGTQRIEATLSQRFPGARILRVDRDTTRRKHAWPAMRARIRAREVDILVGTQMLAKGHDFPHLALVAVLNADGMLYSADFRAAERLYALLTQVAGRAGRGSAQGDVIIQTEFPEHPLYAALRSQDFHRFAAALLDERRRAGFPPFVHQALLRAEAPRVESALEFLEHAREIGRALDGVTLFDPVPAAMMRLAGRERAQLLVQARSRPQLHTFLSAWRDVLAAHKAGPARWSLEIDPLEL